MQFPTMEGNTSNCRYSILRLTLRITSRSGHGLVKTNYSSVWKSATLQEQVGDSYIFQVEFNNPDGSLFVLGPCCGADETEMPPVSQFEYTVSRKAEGKFVVMNTPPYVP